MNVDDQTMTPNPDPNQTMKPENADAESPSDIEDELDALEEIETVNNNLDNLNNVLDYFERRTDDIKAELMNLLLSNREILQSMKEENAQKAQQIVQQPTESESDAGSSNKMEQDMDESQ